MTGTRTVAETSLPGLRLARRGKVRDVYEVDDSHLLIVATDRISAFDCILPTQIERKGEVLTALSRFWFGRLARITPHHLITTDVGQMPESVQASADILRGRSMLVRRTEVFPVECVVRGYLAGSGWKDYLAHGRGLRPPSARGSARVGQAPRAHLHARDQGRRGSRREHQRGAHARHRR